MQRNIDVYEKASKLPMISVVMATYNGARYIKEQLDSILYQSVQSDEVIIRDDCSTDNTVEIVKSFIEENGLNHWRLETNTKNIGWKANFHTLLTETKGDIIFLCDQDDIWLEDKVKKLTEVLVENRDIELIASEFTVFSKKKPVRKKAGKETLERLTMKPSFFHLHYPGAVYVIRRNLVDELEPYWDETMPHDAQLWVLSTIRHSVAIYHQPLILYRRHENTATGRDTLSYEVKKRNIEIELKLLGVVQRYLKEQGSDDKNDLMMVDNAVKHVNYRKELVINRKLSYAIKALPTLGYYSKLKTYFGDLRIALKKQ